LAGKKSGIEYSKQTQVFEIINQPIPFGASIISVNNTIYVAGGAFNVADNGAYFNFTNQVWKLEF